MICLKDCNFGGLVLPGSGVESSGIGFLGDE